MKISKYKIIFLLMISLPFFYISCEEEETLTKDIPDQLFRPVGFTASINGNSISFTWVPIADASYLLEISRDSFLFQQDLQVFPIDGSIDYTLENLWSQARYSARIKSVSKKPEIKDSEYKQITFRTGIENIFYAIAGADIGADHILLTWDATKSVSHILLPNGTTIQLTDSEKQAGQKDITGLTPKTSYTFKIYYGEMLRGTISATTLAN